MKKILSAIAMAALIATGAAFAEGEEGLVFKASVGTGVRANFTDSQLEMRGVTGPNSVNLTAGYNGETAGFTARFRGSWNRTY